LIRASVGGGLWVAADDDIESQSAEPICKMASLDRAKLAAEFQRRRPPQDERKRSMAKYLEVLTPQNCQVIFIDQQPQMAFGVQSIDRQTLKNNVVGLAKAAKVFRIPTTITTVESESFSGFTYPELLAVFPENRILERSSMNSWDDQNVRDALGKNAANGRKKIVAAGLWTEVCNTTFALSCLHDTDYEIYMVADASGGTSADAHKFAMDRMVQAGVVPMTWQQVILEWQRDWARRETYDAVMAIVMEHSGAYGMGVDYAYTHVHRAPERVKHGERIGPNPAK
jgi:nicotinamidase-related amidase